MANALQDNVARKGNLAYYYAHAKTGPEAIKTTLGEAVRVRSREAAADTCTRVRGA